MSKYRKEFSIKNGWSRWIQPVRKGYKMACCDCCLVHILDFRIENGRVQFRAKRNNRSTSLMRRKNGVSVK